MAAVLRVTSAAGRLSPLGMVGRTAAAGFLTIESPFRGLVQRMIEGAAARWILALRSSSAPGYCRPAVSPRPYFSQGATLPAMTVNSSGVRGIFACNSAQCAAGVCPPHSGPSDP